MTLLGFEDIELTFIVILAACSAIASLYGVFKIIKEIKKPNEERDHHLEEIDRKLENDKREIEHLKDMMKLNLKGQMYTLDHILHDDHLDKLEDVRDEIEEFLIIRD